TWQVSLDRSTWQLMGAVSDSSALLLTGTARLRFVPAINQTGQAALTYRAWDQTAGVSGSPFTIASTGGVSSLSAVAVTSTLTVTPGRPGPTWTGTAAALTPVLPFPGQSVGDTVASVFGPLFADTDPNATVEIAIVGLTGTRSGLWQYQLSGSST